MASCQIAQEVSAPGSSLTLLADARLERVSASSFALTGFDADRATARWATYDSAAGALGAERALALQMAAAGPWLATVTQSAPGDTLLVAQAPAVDTSRGDAELHVFAVPASASSKTAPPLGPALARIPGALANGGAPAVALAASRAGPHAVLAWLDPAAGDVELLALSAAGQPLGAPVVIDKAPSFACLGFAPGKGALTLVYHRYDDAAVHVPTLVITELLDSGAVDDSVALVLESHDAGCPQVTPTDAGYAIAFQDVEGSWLGIYDGGTKALALHPFAAAVVFGGAGLQPPLVGLTGLGGDFAAVLQGARGGELWRLSPSGARRGGRLALPSAQGAIGGISTQPDSESMTATYADFTSVDGGLGTAGGRYFLNLACP
ncbi:MAG TPA: hypothetical protein VGK52_03385 [Polyangia bacterium]